MDSMSFYSLFEANKSGLKEQLTGLSLPNDSARIQKIVGQYLEQMLDSKGDLRQSLTQSEDYILQAAMTLLNAQQKIAIESIPSEVVSKVMVEPRQTNEDPFADVEEKSTFSTKDILTIAGTAVGGIGGKMILGSWGAVFGAMAGTALILYCGAAITGSRKAGPSQKTTPEPTKTTLTKPAGQPVKVDSLLAIIGELCKSIDSLIDTYRIQIKRVVHQYENAPKPTLEKEYRALLEGMQSLVGYARTHSPEEEKFVSKILDRIEDLSESLQNYNIEVIDYDGTNDMFFDMIHSDGTIETKMVYPAFVKDGVALLPGKVFTK